MSDTPKYDALRKYLKSQGVEVGGLADRLIGVIEELHERVAELERPKWDGRIR